MRNDFAPISSAFCASWSSSEPRLVPALAEMVPTLCWSAGVATPADQHKVGTISASAGTNLGSLEDQLAQKADEMGAKSFRITSVTGPNTLHGTAVIYK